MSSKREEERNEKIIRGLMKLPPNRRCINCNNLGPQYVCTNFWTFVCITCSGIHREFTHRVKSVSMAKFTSQEVEAIQNGGNQRARETYLKDWDQHRQRLPDSSNADKVREFIKNVYVDRKYAGGRTSDKPPRDVQNFRNREDETRRASSYHSYSQSPPYDHQYEDRRYGKQAHALSRKPGSDRGLYEGKVSSFLSPSRLSDHMYEDRFTNEGSISRASDYSVSSGGDPFRSDVQSPTFQRDIEFSSPSSQTSRDISNEDGHYQTMNSFLEAKEKRDADGIPRPLRTASEPKQLAGTYQDKQSAFSSLPRSVSETYGGLDLFNAPVVSQNVSSSVSAIDLFQLRETSSTPSVDLFQPSPVTSVPTFNAQPPQVSLSSVDLFSETYLLQSAATFEKKSADGEIANNEGWATFDVPHQMASNLEIANSAPMTMAAADGIFLDKYNPGLSVNTSLQWPTFQDSSAPDRSLSMSNPWQEGMQNFSASLTATSTQSWNAFEDYVCHLPNEGMEQSREQVVPPKPPSTVDLHSGLGVSEDTNGDGIQTSTLDGVPPVSSVPSIINQTSYTPAANSHMIGQSNANEHKSTNPFDLPYDSDFESGNMFLDMSTLQVALPNSDIPPSFLAGVSQPWFHQNPVTPYVPDAPQGALGLMATQPPSTQIRNVPTQGPVASIGGNPFA